MTVTYDPLNNTHTYQGDTFKIIMHRYSDPHRLNAARNAAIYLGKSDRDNIRRPLSVLRMGHVPEVFRGEFAEFEFIDVSKEVYDHLITYTTRNMRVAGGNRALTSDDYTLPSDRMKNSEEVRMAVSASMDNYNHLLTRGEVPQIARQAMPIGAKLNPFVFQFNFVTLMQSIFPQRIWEKGAQGNTVKVVQGLWELVQYVDGDLWHTVFENFGYHVKEWKDVQKKWRKNGLTVSQLITEICKEGLDTSAEEAIRNLFGGQKSMWD